MHKNPTPTKELIDFPCKFLIKAIGENHETFQAEVLYIIKKHVNNFDETQDLKFNFSSNQKYITANIDVYVKSREHLDAIYTDLNRHHLMRITL